MGTCIILLIVSQKFKQVEKDQINVLSNGMFLVIFVQHSALITKVITMNCSISDFLSKINFLMTDHFEVLPA